MDHHCIGQRIHVYSQNFLLLVFRVWFKCSTFLLVLLILFYALLDDSAFILLNKNVGKILENIYFY